MHADDVQVLLDLDVLVGLGHAARERAVDEPGDAALPPEPRVGAPEADDGRGFGPAQRPAIGAEDVIRSPRGRRCLGVYLSSREETD